MTSSSGHLQFKWAWRYTWRTPCAVMRVATSCGRSPVTDKSPATNNTDRATINLWPGRFWQHQKQHSHQVMMWRRWNCRHWIVRCTSTELLERDVSWSLAQKSPAKRLLPRPTICCRQKVVVTFLSQTSRCQNYILVSVCTSTVWSRIVYFFVTQNAFRAPWKRNKVITRCSASKRDVTRWAQFSFSVYSPQYIL